MDNDYDASQPLVVDGDQPLYRVYGFRFLVLVAFCIFSFAESLAWFSYAGFPAPSQAFYGVDAAAISWYLFIGPICCLAAFPGTIWLLDKRGLRLTIGLAAGAVMLSSAFRMLSLFVDQSAAWPLALTGQVFGSFAGPAAMSSGPRISAVWFSPTERSMSTAFAVVANSLGSTLGFLLGLPCAPGGTFAEPGRCVSFQLYLQLGVSSLSLLTVLVFVRDAPQTPTSRSSDRDVSALSVKSSLRSLLTRPSFVALLLTAGCSMGVFSTWAGLLDLILAAEGPTTAAWLGFASNASILVGGLAAGAVAARFRFRHREVAAALFGGAAVLFALFTLMLMRVIPATVVGLTVTLVGGSLLCAGVNPLFYELAAELAYPASEGLVGNLVSIPNNVFGAAFYPLQAYLAPVVINWLNVGNSALFALVMLLFVKGTYQRAITDGMLSTERTPLGVQAKDE